MTERNGGDITVVLSDTPVEISLAERNITTELGAGIIRITPERYSGSYTVQPSHETAITLDTANRYLTNDVTVDRCTGGASALSAVCVLVLAEYLAMNEHPSSVLYLVRG